MNDIDRELTFRLADLPGHLPLGRGGRKFHPSTCFRWAKTGLRGVRLETIPIGGAQYTSKEAALRFFDALAAARGGIRPTPAGPSPAARRAARELEALGF